jgi:hypothetical protein
MHTTTITQWQPLTLQGAGLFHIAMGAVLGIAALGRTQEKMAGANNGGASIPAAPAAFSVPPAAPSSFAAPAAPSFSAPSTPSSFGGGGFGSAPKAASESTEVAFSSSGKPMPKLEDNREM